MIRRIIQQSVARRKRRKLLSFVAVALGIAVLTTVATLAVDVGDKVNRELSSVGANIVVTPAAGGFPVSVGGVDFRPAGAGDYLDESALPAIKKIFWRNSVEAFAPFIYVPASAGGRRFVLIGTWFEKNLRVAPNESFTTGIERLHPAWKVEGAWPEAADDSGCVLGAQLARSLGIEPGQTVAISTGASSRKFVVRGIVETGGIEDQEALAPLESVQAMAGLAGKVRRVEVSAMTKPADALARIPAAKMTPAQYEMWSCSNYASTVAYQIQQAIPGSSARAVYQISEGEGKIMNRVGLLMAVLAAAALIVAALAIASMMLANVLERRTEIGLLKALGATDARIASIFLLEACAVGLAGGAIGYALGSALAERLSWAVFGSAASIHWVIFPCALALALIVTLAGSAPALRRGLRMPASVALRSE